MDTESIKVECEKCGALILPTTAEETGGLCMPCKKGRVPENRSLGGLKEGPVLSGVVLGGLLVLFGFIVYRLLVKFETTNGGFRAHWLIVIAYRLGGKWLIAGILVVIGVSVIFSSVWRKWQSTADKRTE